jgi:allantoin racemase
MFARKGRLVMRIKVINPNTTAGMTAKIGEAARAVAAPGTEIVAVSPAAGPVSIECHYDEAVSVLGVLEEVRKGEEEGCDGYVIACFGDPGLLAAREIAKGPVVGIAEAAMHAASFIATGFSVVTTLTRTCVIAEHLVERYGMAHACRKVRGTDIPVLDLEETGRGAFDAIVAECRRAVAEDRSGAVVLGCAGMADLVAAVQRAVGVPVIDGVAAAVVQVEGLVRLGLGTSKHGDLAWPPAKAYAGDLARFAPPPR